MATILWGSATSTALGFALTSLASGAYALSAEIDNTTGLYENAAIMLTLPSSVTAGSGAPFIGFTALYAMDGTTYPNPPGSTAAATGIPQVASIAAVPSAAFTSGHTLPFLILPFKTKILLYQNLGVALPSTGTFVANLYRWAETVS